MLRSFVPLTAALLLFPSPSRAGADEGQVAWQAGDYTRAVAEWRPAALEGDADAQYGLAQAYLYGRGLPTDLNQAELWFRKAAAQGHVEAADNLGLLLFQQERRRDALPYLERSAARGEPRAQYVLGTAKFNGDVVDRDWVGGYALMTRASAAGLPQASRALAQMDREIPLAQRQEGLVLARALEASGMRLAAAEPTIAADRAAGSDMVAPATAGLGSPPRATAQPPTPPSAAAAAPTAPASAAIARPKLGRATPRPVAASSVTPGGRWLVQVGAFRNRSGAEQRFQAVRSSSPLSAELQPFYEQVGDLTRVRAGPFGSRGAAERACLTLRARGQPCFPVSR